MTIRSFAAFAFFVAALATAPLAAASSFELYTVEGYLDRAPSDAKVIGRLDVTDPDARTRAIFVTAYRSRGPAYVGSELSRAARLRGRPEEMSRLVAAPAGAAVKLTFAVYQQAVPSVLIVQLGDQAA